MNYEPIDTASHERTEGDCVERVARALCWHEQRNPDLMIDSGLKEFVVSLDGIATLEPAIIPAWKKYIDEAIRIVLVMQAFSKI